MKSIKHLLILTLSLAGIHSVQAQSSLMKDPVSFRLRNGLTVIVAENQGTGKIFSNFSSESQLSQQINKAGAQEILISILNSRAQNQAQQVTFTEKGGNINAIGSDFNMALEALSNSIQHPFLTEEALEQSKTALIDSIEARTHYYSPEITVAAIQALSLRDIQALYHDLMIPSSSYLTIAGKISVAEAKILTKKAFGNWKGAEHIEISK